MRTQSLLDSKREPNKHFRSCVHSEMYRLAIAPYFRGTEVQISKDPLTKRWWLWFFTWLLGSIGSVPCLNNHYFSDLRPSALSFFHSLVHSLLVRCSPCSSLNMPGPLPTGTHSSLCLAWECLSPEHKLAPASWPPFAFTAGPLHRETFPSHSAPCQPALRDLGSPLSLLDFASSGHLLLVNILY